MIFKRKLRVTGYDFIITRGKLTRNGFIISGKWQMVFKRKLNVTDRVCSAAQLVNWSAGQLVSRSAGQLVSQSAG
jgi:hypothetical protein